jgi:acyl transferase domain-containing protein
VPSEATPWPVCGLRRVSVNSFGASGTNAHAILDDAYHYLRDRGLSANHFTIKDPPSAITPSLFQEDLACQLLSNSLQSNQTIEKPPELTLNFPRILALSALDKPALQRVIDSYQHWARERPWNTKDFSLFVDDVSYTLSKRRSLFIHRTFAVVDSERSFLDLASKLSPPTRATNRPHVAFVFTGQGAQWSGMARELMRVPAFYNTLRDADAYLKGLGSEWSAIGAFTIHPVAFSNYFQTLSGARATKLTSIARF